MRKNFFFILFLAMTATHTMYGRHHGDTSAPVRKVRIAILAPLYLDSIYSATGNFRYQQSMPKFMMPALDFVNGAITAIDSLHPENARLEALIVDTKSTKLSLEQLFKQKKMDSIDLLIGSIKDADFKTTAAFALQKNIPFISATYPNDGGIVGNPFVVIVNSTLRAHCEAIYSYLIQNHGTDRIYLCKKNGMQEDKIADYFKKMNERDGKPLIPIQTINFDSTIGADMIQKKLDSNRTSVIIGGSLDENFAAGIAAVSKDLNNLHYPIKLIGMPNWDGFKSLIKEELSDFPIYFTSPYFNNKTDTFSNLLQNAYLQKVKGRPTDMAFKGFECTYLFSQILLQHPDDFLMYLNSDNLQLYSKFNFKPVFSSTKNTTPDYIENKHLYFLKILNGKIEKSW